MLAKPPAAATPAAVAALPDARGSRWTPRLRTVLFAMHTVLLLLLLQGIVLLRLYESVMIRRTEAQLIAQGAVVVETFRTALTQELASSSQRHEYGVPVALEHRVQPGRAPFAAVSARLDLARDRVRPPAEQPRPSGVAPDAAAVAAAATLSAILRRAQATTLAGVRVVDHAGMVVASSRQQLGLSLAHREEVARALSGETLSLIRQRISDEPPPALDSLSRRTRIRVFVAMPVVEADRVWGAVVLSRTPMSVTQSMYGIRWFLVGGAAALLVLITIVSVFSSWTITRPIQELIKQAERVASGERGAVVELDKPGSYEVEQLCGSVARMAQTLEQRADYINTFASNVSHEFKTPLASIRGTVELLRDHFDEMQPEERERFLGNLEQDAQRLGLLVRRLHELARADVVQPTREQADIVAVMRKLASSPDVEFAGSREPVGVQMAGELVESVLSNLIDNARLHGGMGTQIRLALAEQGLPDAVEITVSDNGKGISAANLARVYDRFFTTARSEGGSGLGLSIVKALLEAHGGSISISSVPGNTAVSLRLPRA